ncbi:MAG: hypothetical protein RJA76_406 [Bacteroidota bacterium]|jgi:outer membrane protein OmpA-like peptidoglycan-associated protein
MATFIKQFIFIGTFSLLLLSCNGIEQIFKKGQNHFEKGEYELAIQALKPLSEKGYEPSSTNFIIAESYRLSNRIKLAGTYYQLSKLAGNTEKLIPYYLAYAAKANGNYEEEKVQLKNFLASKPSKNLRLRAEIELEQLDKIEVLATKKSLIELENVEGNTSGSEFAPRMLDGDLILSSSKKTEMYKNNGLPMIGLYRAKLKNPSSISSIDLFSNSIFQANSNEGTPAFSKNGELMVFARGNTGKKDISPDVDLYISRKENGQWSVPTYLSISDSLAWDGSPAFSADGKTLYFASNRRGGKGGLDLYRVNMDNSGRFGRAINLGSAINTPGDELFPFVSEDGKLYFSSNGHAGLGGLDLFVASRNGNEIEVEHLGAPLNSISDDFGLIMTDENHGYLTSNREGGKGDDDIYFFTGKGIQDRWWSDEILKTPEEQEQKIVRYFLKPQFIDLNGKGIPNVKYRIRKNGETLGSTVSDKNGQIPTIDLAENDEIEILAEKEEYLTKRENFSMEGRAIPPLLLKKAITDTTYNLAITMDKPEVGKEITQLYQINTIYYDLDKSDIRTDAAIELDKIVQFLNDNEYVSLELGSHTDARASASYNIKLSQRRAESAVNYIVSKGIQSNRLKAKGYGETQLINECADGVNCTEEQHQENRRTEFVIIDLKSE